MSPVSFQTVGGGENRTLVLAQARALTTAGIRVFDVDVERGLLIRSDQVSRAELVLASLLQADAAVEKADVAVEQDKETQDRDSG